MKKYILSILCFISVAISGCNYLNMVPEKDIETIETIFERRLDTEMWWTALYGDFHNYLGNHGGNPAYFGADEYIANQRIHDGGRLPSLKIAAGQQMSQEPYCPTWKGLYMIIRNCNIFLENIHRTYNLPENEREWWIADTKALKAMIYFELMRHYGPICLIPQNMPVDLEVEAYQLPRQHVDKCFKEIIDLLEEAEPDIPAHSSRTSAYGHTICLEGLLALKAKVLLYAASPLFNGNIYYRDFVNKNKEPLFNTTYDHEKWHLAAKAADKAVEICEGGDRKLYKGDDGKKTKLLNFMNDIEYSVYSTFNNPEFLMESKYTSNGFYNFILPNLESDPAHADPYVDGSMSPSMKMVEMYYTVNGVPIDEDNTWNYTNRHKKGSESSYLYEDVIPLNSDVISLHLRREPRFYASIAGDRMYYQRGLNTFDESYNLLVKARKDEEPWGTPYDIIRSDVKQNITGYWLKKHLLSKFPTKGYVNHLAKNETSALIRLPELYLMQSEAWNEYLEIPDNRVHDPLDKIRFRAGIPPVKEAWKNYTNNGEKVDTRIGMRDIIHQEYNIELAFEGHRYWNIRRWWIAHEVMNEKQYCWNILGTDFESFYNGGAGPKYEIDRYKFISPRDYLAPIKAEEILISGMRQNPKW